MGAVSEYDLHARVDGELTAADEEALARELATDPDAAACLLAYTEQTALLREAFRAVPERPESMRTLALERELAARLERRRSAPGLRTFLSRAAVVAVVFGAGWLAHTGYVETGAQMPALVAEAAGSHGVYAEDREHPAEFGPAADLGEGVRWMSAKLGEDLVVPDLGRLGVDLVGARLVGTREGPLAQFIYEDAPGERMTLTMAQHHDDVPLDRVVTVDSADRVIGYWSDGRLDYVLIAKVSDHKLREIVTEVAKDVSLGADLAKG